MSKSRPGWADAAPYQKQQAAPPRWEDLAVSANFALQAVHKGSLMGSLILRLPPERFDILKNHSMFVKEMALYKRDFESFHNELKVLIAEHSDKKGLITNGDDNMSYLVLGEKYISWVDRFAAVMQPTIANLQLRITSILNPTEIDAVKSYLVAENELSRSTTV